MVRPTCDPCLIRELNDTAADACSFRGPVSCVSIASPPPFKGLNNGDGATGGKLALSLDGSRFTDGKQRLRMVKSLIPSM